MGELRTQFRTQGYVWLKGFYDREAILKFRGRFFSAFTDLGLLAPGSNPRKGRFSGSNMSKGWLTQDLKTLAENTDARWLVADYEAGDMVAHSAYMIHAATDRPAGASAALDRHTLPKRSRRDRRSLGEPLVARRYVVRPKVVR